MVEPQSSEPIFPCVHADAELDLGYVGGNGRTKPVLIATRSTDGGVANCVVKLAGHLDEPPLEYLCEWVSWAVARKMGVTCPDVRAVSISTAFATQLRTDPVSVAEESVGLAFGSVACSALSVGPAIDLAPEQALEAWRLISLDVLLLNPDRRHDNPNLLQKKARLVAIDHELACRFHLPLIGADVTTDAGTMIVARHVLKRGLRIRRKPAPDGMLLAAIESVDDSFLATLLEHTPREWTTGRASGKLEQMVTVLSKRRSNASTWLPQMIQAVKS